jgi:hypothetical protein
VPYRWDSCVDRSMRLQGLDKPIREHGDAVLASLPVPDELVLVQVHVLDTQPGSLHEPQFEAVQERLAITHRNPSAPRRARTRPVACGRLLGELCTLEPAEVLFSVPAGRGTRWR